MFADEINKKVAAIIKKFGTNDPFLIANEMGIMVRFSNDFKKLKGLYTIIKRKRVIIINNNISLEKQRIVCAHELGHDTIHRELASNNIFQEFMIYDMAARPEYEANMFAAELLISDDEIYELSHSIGYDMEKIAKNLNTDINLVGIKLANMNYRGFDFNIGIPPKNNFLR